MQGAVAEEARERHSGRQSSDNQRDRGDCGERKRVFLSHLYINDLFTKTGSGQQQQHRENSKNDHFLSGAAHAAAAVRRPRKHHRQGGMISECIPLLLVTLPDKCFMERRG